MYGRRNEISSSVDARRQLLIEQRWLIEKETERQTEKEKRKQRRCQMKVESKLKKVQRWNTQSNDHRYSWCCRVFFWLFIFCNLGIVYTCIWNWNNVYYVQYQFILKSTRKKTNGVLEKSTNEYLSIEKDLRRKRL